MVCLIVGVPGKPPKFFSTVAGEVHKAIELAKILGFREIYVFENEQAERKRLELFWAELTAKCIRHRQQMERDGTPDIKFVLMVYYTGPGDVACAEQRVWLNDD